jgi:hypothetical protein
MKDQPTPLFWASYVVFMLLALIAIGGHVLDRPGLWVPAMAALFLGAAIAGAGRNLRFWRGQTRESRMIRPPVWWKWSPGVWRANVRSSTVMSVGGVGMMASASLVLAVRELDWPGPPDELAWFEALEAVTALVWIGVPALAISVALFNRPRLVVPPHLRDQPGLVHGGNDDPEIGAEEHRTPGQLGLKGHFPEGRFGEEPED